MQPRQNYSSQSSFMGFGQNIVRGMPSQQQYVQQQQNQNLDFNQLYMQNEMKFRDAYQRQQVKRTQEDQKMQQILDNQTKLIASMLGQNMTENPQFYQQQQVLRQRPMEINLKSIMLKPLQYYSQQMNGVEFQYQPPKNAFKFDPHKYVKDVQPRLHTGASTPYMRPPQQDIQIQTDNDITKLDTNQKQYRQQYEEEFKKMQQKLHYLENRPHGIMEEPQLEDIDDQYRYRNKKYQGDDWDLSKQFKEKEQPKPEEEKPKRNKFKPLPPGMNKQQRAKHNLAVFKAGMKFILHYLYDIHQKINKKRQYALEFKGKQTFQCFGAFKSYFVKTSGKMIESFASTKQSLYVTDKKKTQEDDMRKRIAGLKHWVRKLSSTLIEHFDTDSIPPDMLEFIGSITHNTEFLPQNVLFQFEINRFYFTQFGAIKNIKKDHAKMFIITLLIIRVWIFRMILTPWADFKEIRKKEFLTTNCYMTASLLYEIVIDFVKKKWFKVGQNQGHLPIKIQNRENELGPLLCGRFEPPEDPEELREMRSIEEPLIKGLEEREDFANIMSDKKFVREIETYYDEWSESIYFLAHRKWLSRKTKIRLTLFTEHINFINEFYKGHDKEKKEALKIANEDGVRNEKAQLQFLEQI